MATDARVTSDAGVTPDAGVAQAAVQPEFIWPLPSSFTRTLSGFGVRVDPLDPERKKTEGHTGLDIPAPEGTDIYAAAAGTVKQRTQHNPDGELIGYGNYVDLTHTPVWMTRYAHCSEFVGKDGATVKQGEVIAKVGKSGRVTGPHLHFEVLQNHSWRDPAKYVSPTGK